MYRSNMPTVLRQAVTRGNAKAPNRWTAGQSGLDTPLRPVPCTTENYSEFVKIEFKNICCRT